LGVTAATAGDRKLDHAAANTASSGVPLPDSAGAGLDQPRWTYGLQGKIVPVMIYGTHLLLIAAVNLLLWIGVRQAAARVRIVRSSLALALFAGALAAGAMRPGLALYFWLAVLATPPLAAVLAQHLGYETD